MIFVIFNTSHPKPYIAGVFDDPGKTLEYLSWCRHKHDLEVQRVETDFPLYIVERFDFPEVFPPEAGEAAGQKPDEEGYFPCSDGCREDIHDYSLGKATFGFAAERPETERGDTLYTVEGPWQPPKGQEGLDYMGAIPHEHS